MVMACHSAHSCWRSRSEFDTGTVPVPADTTNQSQLMMLMVKTVIETCQQVYVDMSGTATLLLACARLHQGFHAVTHAPEVWRMGYRMEPLQRCRADL